jgi:hypothetical protein
MASARFLVVSSVALLAALAAPHPLASQADTIPVMIAGTVIDPLRQPIEGAEVRIVGTTVSALTSKAGSFRLFAPRAGEMLIQIRRPGYSAQLLKLTGEWSGTVLLEPGKFELPELNVTARYAKPARYAATTKYDDYFRRRRGGFGEFISREDIERRNPFRAVEILQGRAGIKVSLQPPGNEDDPTIVAFARCSEFPPKINVYIDGRKQMPQGRALADAGSASPLMDMARGVSFEQAMERRRIRGVTAEMLDRINPSDIELIEIFRGPGELPPEFNDGNCGAIVIWTRQTGF